MNPQSSDKYEKEYQRLVSLARRGESLSKWGFFLIGIYGMFVVLLVVMIASQRIFVVEFLRSIVLYGSVVLAAGVYGLVYGTQKSRKCSVELEALEFRWYEYLTATNGEAAAHEARLANINKQVENINNDIRASKSSQSAGLVVVAVYVGLVFTGIFTTAQDPSGVGFLSVLIFAPLLIVGIIVWRSGASREYNLRKRLSDLLTQEL